MFDNLMAMSSMLSLLEITGVVLAAVLLFLQQCRSPWRLRKRKEDVKGVPGPRSLPIFGTSWIFAVGRYGLNELHLYYRHMYDMYGPIVKEEALGNVPVISLYEKADIEKVLRAGGKYPLRPPCEAMAQYRRSRPDRYSSVGFVNEQGEIWHNLRMALTSVLISPKTISNFIPHVHQIADDWSHQIRQLRSNCNDVSNLELVIDNLGLEITCALVLGRRMGLLLPGGETETAKKLAKAVRGHFLATRDTYFGLPLWKYITTPAYSRLIRCEEEIYDLTLELIESADDAAAESEVFRSVLSADVDDRERTVTIIDFIAAGIHTLKNSLLFLLHLVGRDPHIQEQILADPTGQYAKACMAESFRLYPTASPLARITDEQLDLSSGYCLPPGTVVLCHTGIACRDERLFRLANEFRPERWLNGEKTASRGGALFCLAPFGVGRRICPGKRFIETILPIILQSTIENFALTSHEPLDIQFEFLLTPTGPITMTFKDRN